MEGIKETKELLTGVNEIAVRLIKIFKDGVQLSDVGQLIILAQTDEALKAAVKAAGDAVQKVPEELQDLTVLEGIELGMLQMSYVPKILEALK